MKSHGMQATEAAGIVKEVATAGRSITAKVEGGTGEWEGGISREERARMDQEAESFAQGLMETSGSDYIRMKVGHVLFKESLQTLEAVNFPISMAQSPNSAPYQKLGRKS